MRIAAIGDIHCARTPEADVRDVLARAGASADVLLLWGDSTDYGQPEEARGRARALAVVSIPSSPCTATTTTSPASRKPGLRRGTLLSRAQYLADIECWGDQDARLLPAGNLPAADTAHWTAAIEEEHRPRVPGDSGSVSTGQP